MAHASSSIRGEDSGSESHHSEVGGAREEYFSETTATHLRRSERQHPPLPDANNMAMNTPNAEENPLEPPTHTIEQKWYEEEGYVIMCWHVFKPGFSGLYMVDGTIRDADKPEIYEHIVTSEHARSGRLRILSVPASMAKTLHKKLDYSMALNIMPIKKD